ncbi:hypothetical protein GCM10011505_25710 [Tistrella bauzanensis]|uniref:ABC transmembrane type-1 domain-containing protein n=1 Tax=Tistrella bauzanensis TaxID=657419 RepID=A0ABQ1IJU0_9PROT|nr:ABC transporter permease [Tistrella bauzanensis]GGB43199.1 hypothetical protein GCM10011505_25710 [Tistrella bauzanensis]
MSTTTSASGGDRLGRAMMRLYLGLFLFYLFLPLVVMGAATFNDSRLPTVTPWTGTTLKWFEALYHDSQMWDGLVTSLLAGAGVVVVAVPVGTAAALLLDGLRGRSRSFAFALMVSPLLTPGVIIGISTLVFWRQLAVGGGLFLIIVAQSTYIAAYVMLMVQARLQRFDRGLEDAARDLGASPWMSFRRITLPFLAPTMVAGAFIAFLQSFENYNTTLFVRGFDTPLTVYIASKVRTGVTPAVNALGLILIALTIIGAVVYELLRRRAARRIPPVS